MRRVISISAVLVAFAYQLVSQSISGSIAGTVFDPQGAAVPGAAVVATDIDRNTSLTGKTDTGGGFTFPQVLPSHYTITVERQGFKKYERRGLVVLANSVLSVPPIRLESRHTE